jgi:hypothetical protein
MRKAKVRVCPMRLEPEMPRWRREDEKGIHAWDTLFRAFCTPALSL